MRGGGRNRTGVLKRRRSRPYVRSPRFGKRRQLRLPRTKSRSQLPPGWSPWQSPQRYQALPSLLSTSLRSSRRRSVDGLLGFKQPVPWGPRPASLAQPGQSRSPYFWHVSFCPVFYEASGQPRHATFDPVTPVETFSPPKEQLAIFPEFQCPLNLPIQLTALDRLPLVKGALALGQGQLHLDSGPLEVQLRRNEGEPPAT